MLKHSQLLYVSFMLVCAHPNLPGMLAGRWWNWLAFGLITLMGVLYK
jgi:hypothetical protein